MTADQPITILSTRLFDDRGARRHPQRSVCPGCGDNIATVALTRLLYVFTPCSCPAEDYQHLYEQVWHRSCLVDAGAGDDA